MSDIAEVDQWLIVEKFAWRNFEVIIEGASELGAYTSAEPDLFQVLWRRTGGERLWEHMFETPLAHKPSVEEIMSRLIDIDRGDQQENEQAANSAAPEHLKYKIQATVFLNCFRAIQQLHKARGTCPVCQLAWSINGDKHDKSCPIAIATKTLIKLNAF